MRSTPTIQALVLLGLACPPGGVSAGTEALLVGVGDYARSKPLKAQRINAHEVPSAGNDLALMQSLVRLVYGSDARCTTLLDERATWDNVLAELERLARRTAPEDSVLVYFTAHGAVLRGPNGNVAGRALLLWDQELLGGVLRHWLGQLKARNKSVIIDSCFAGAVERGPRSPDDAIMKSVVIDTGDEGNAAGDGFLPLLEARAPGERGGSEPRDYALLAACLETAPAYAAPFSPSRRKEKRWYSAFTLALFQSLISGTDAAPDLEAATHRTLQALLQPLGLRQKPLIRRQPQAGARLFARVTNSGITASRLPGSRRWALPVGLAAGVVPGTVLRVPEVPGAKLTVSESFWSAAEALDAQRAVESSRCTVVVDPATTVALRPASQRRKGEIVGLDPDGTEVAGTRWALVIALNDYVAYPDLRWCVADGQGLIAALTSPAVGIRPENVRFLADGAQCPADLPLRSNMLAALGTWLQTLGPNDLVVVAFIGHGEERNDSTYLLPRDAVPGLPEDTWLPLARVRTELERCPARRKLLILDTCHSGGRGDTAMGAVTDRDLRESAGMATIASCQLHEKSREWPEKQHGVFSYYLIEALSQPRQTDADGDGYVSVHETYNWVYKRVRDWSTRRGGPTQTPVLAQQSVGRLFLAKAHLEEVTRFDACEAVLRAFPLAASGTTPITFRDVPPNHEHYAAVAALASHGLIEAYDDDEFCGDRTLSRYEWAFLLFRLHSLLTERFQYRFASGEGDPRFVDVPLEHWAYSAVRSLSQVLRLPGSIGFEGARPLLHAQMTRELQRFSALRKGAAAE